MGDAMPERWLPVVGYEGLYLVSDLGRVYSVRRPGVGKTGRIRKLSPVAGYPSVSLCRNGVQTTYYVHRLVMEAFVGPCREGQEVRHLDGDPSDNRLVRLAYGTPGENQMDNVRLGTHHYAGKTHCPQNHEYTPENTKVIPSRPNARYCRACHRERSRAAWRQKHWGEVNHAA